MNRSTFVKNVDKVSFAAMIESEFIRLRRSSLVALHV